jgi:hypothetical protein
MRAWVNTTTILVEALPSFDPGLQLHNTPSQHSTHERPEPVPGREMVSSNLILDAGSTMAAASAAQRPRARRALSLRERNMLKASLLLFRDSLLMGFLG